MERKTSQPEEAAGSTEQRLRAEIAGLKRQLQDERKLALEASKMQAVRPSRGRLWSIVAITILALAVAFVVGYLPRQRRESVLQAEAKVESVTAPVVNVVAVDRASGASELVLPGSIQAITE